MPRNQSATRPRCPEVYAYIEEAQARLDGSKPIRQLARIMSSEPIDEGRLQVWEKVPGAIRDRLNRTRDAVLPLNYTKREALAFNIRWLKERYAP